MCVCVWSNFVAYFSSIVNNENQAWLTWTRRQLLKVSDEKLWYGARNGGVTRQLWMARSRGNRKVLVKWAGVSSWMIKPNLLYFYFFILLQTCITSKVSKCTERAPSLPRLGDNLQPIIWCGEREGSSRKRLQALRLSCWNRLTIPARLHNMMEK